MTNKSGPSFWKVLIRKISANTKCSRFFFYWLPAILYALFLFYLSQQQDITLPKFPMIDKIGHMALYCGFGFFFSRAVFPFYRKRHLKLLLLAAVLGAVAYGVTDEFHQSFVPTRSPELADIVADSIGGLLGGLLLYVETYLHKRCLED